MWARRCLSDDCDSSFFLKVLNFSVFSQPPPPPRNGRLMATVTRTSDDQRSSLSLSSSFAAGLKLAPQTVTASVQSDDWRSTTDGSASSVGSGGHDVELTVKLLNDKLVRIKVDPRMQMLDLLIQLCAACKVSPSDMYIKVPVERRPGYYEYKPSMMVGNLQYTYVEMVPKSSVIEKVKKLKSHSWLFEGVSCLAKGWRIL
ncbi:unnamed protein product [Soboliphyme baturini]|uniref:RBD domain-containing protein n=1 Tax=Soboliphyme baturini TaxID=241478 RepID=A0A183IR83_9BILA|nr:unnamed protein product [Soboliphyme baturini]